MLQSLEPWKCLLFTLQRSVLVWSRTLRHSLFGPGTLDPFVCCFNSSSSWLKSSILSTIFDICLVFSTEKLICYQVINKFILSLPVDLISKWCEKKQGFDCLRLKWLNTFKWQVSLWEILWKKIYMYIILFSRGLHHTTLKHYSLWLLIFTCLIWSLN